MTSPLPNKVKVRDAFNRIARLAMRHKDECGFLGTGGGREILLKKEEDCTCVFHDLKRLQRALKHGGVIASPRRNTLLSKQKKR